MTDTHVVVLAAGQGTRMKSQLPKVLHQISGRPMIEHVLHAAQAVTPATVTVIVGHRADLVRERLSGALPEHSSSLSRNRSGAPRTRSNRPNPRWRDTPGPSFCSRAMCRC
jgi:bifunctional N-acetylglucosamine-1-phosphate-uridyltransferase/glucosamine-1-phosphate-acetyltransferase GlmU-like protein